MSVAGRESTVRLDRLTIRTIVPHPGPPRSIKGFRLAADTRVRSQTNVTTYKRVRTFHGITSGTKVYWQHQPNCCWLAPGRVTLVGTDETGLTPKEIARIFKSCSIDSPALVELAFDFGPKSGVNSGFVKRYGVFGKSRRRRNRGGVGQLRFGARRSGKLVRCYWKDTLKSYRVELEMHWPLLKKHGIVSIKQLSELPEIVQPQHLQFVTLRWKALKRLLIQRFGTDATQHLQETKQRWRSSLKHAERYLSHCGVMNVHRYRKPLLINRKIRNALKRWAYNFAEE